MVRYIVVFVMGVCLLSIGVLVGMRVSQCDGDSGVAYHAEVAVDSLYGVGSFVSGLKGVRYSSEDYSAFDLRLKGMYGQETNVVVSVDKRVKPVRVVFWPNDAWHKE